MALGTTPPWVRGVDALGAISSGASAGASAANIEQQGRSDAARLGLEAMRMKQTTALEQARLQQAAEQHQMEFQARQKLAEQQQLRLQQQLNIQNAYKTAMFGVAQGRLEHADQIADAKAKDAALLFQREQGFARDVASGVPVMEAYQRNPVSATTLSAVHRTFKTTPEATNKVMSGKSPLVRINPDGTTTVVYTPPASDSLTGTDKEDLRDLRHERDILSKRLVESTENQRLGIGRLVNPEENKKNQDRLTQIEGQIEGIKRGGLKPPTNSTGTTTAKDRVVRANALAIAHPDWTKEQILKAVLEETQ